VQREAAKSALGSAPGSGPEFTPESTPESTPGAASVGALVGAAARRLAWTRAAQSCSLALCTVFVVAAAIELDGADFAGASAFGVAVLCGVSVAAVWWREQSLAPHEVARLVDRRLELRGAFATAHEAEQRALSSSSFSSSSLARALAARAAKSLGVSQLRRALPPPAFVWLAAPILSASMWLAADAVRPAAAPELAALAERLRESVANLPGAGSEQVRERAEQLAQAARAADPAPLVRALERAVEALRALDEGAAGAAGLELELQALEQRLAAAARRLGAGANAPGNDGGGGSALQSGAQQRTMAGSTDDGHNRRHPALERATPGELSPQPLVPSVDAPESAVLAGRWWPAQHDAVVDAWRRGEAPR